MGQQQGDSGRIGGRKSGGRGAEEPGTRRDQPEIQRWWENPLERGESRAERETKRKRKRKRKRKTKKKKKKGNPEGTEKGHQH